MLNIYHNGAGSGDYYKVYLNELIYYEGHTIPLHVWLSLLNDLDVNAVSELHLTDEQLEEIYK